MNDHIPSGHGARQLSLLERVDQICDRFEAQWKPGVPLAEQPRIEDFLGEVTEAERPTLLGEMLALELAYRHDAGDSFTPEEYRGRFPKDGTVVDQAFAELKRPAAPSDGDTPVDSAQPPGHGPQPLKADSLPTVDRDPALDSRGAAETVQPPAGGISTLARFQPLRLHARGGLGEVYVAQDSELRRQVAFKQMQERYADDPHSRQRFLREAEITGGLEHPGIVPVYGLGQDAAGRPFYAMRFIQGDSLKAAIARFHQADTPGRDPGERTLALRGLLGRFVALCNAVAYAHSRGVLHRDLKPGNVMLGPYGETLVVDWGLAKPVGRSLGSDESAACALEPTLASNLARTQVGQPLGTPEYMPPEQAAGRLDELGPASDVYGLGATLYCLLTGKAPFDRAAGQPILERVQRGDFLPPRQVKPSVPPALAAVCLKAMALRPQDRYATAKALAEDIEHWLADEPVSCWREPWRLRLRRWGRRHRGMVSALAAAAVVLVVVGGIGAWWLGGLEAEWRADQERAQDAVKAALQQIEEFQDKAEWDKAKVVLVQALSRLPEEGADELRQRLEQARINLGLVRRIERVHLQSSAWVDGKFDSTGAAKGYAAVFRMLGLNVAGDPGVVARQVAASPIRNQLVAALDRWALAAFQQRDTKTQKQLLAVARRVDPGRWRDQVRNPAVWSNRHALTRLAAEAGVARSSPVLLGLLGGLLDASGGDAIGLLDLAQRQHPADFWLSSYLADAFFRRRRWEEAAGYYRTALAVRPSNPALYNNLGDALYAKRDLDAAIHAYGKAIALDPKLAQAHNNLGNALKARGDLGGAIAAYRRAIALDPKDAKAHANLGNTLYAKKDLDGAIAEYREAIGLEPTIGPSVYNVLGAALYAKRDLDAAITAYRRGIALDAKDAMAHSNLGLTLKAKGDLDGAIAEYQKSITLDPKLAQAHNNLGLALKDKGNLDAAIAAYRRAIALDPKYASAHSNLGGALYAKRDLDGAIAEIQKAIALDPKNAKAHANLGSALTDKRDLAGAIAAFRKAIALDPKFATAQFGLGNGLYAKGDLEGAIAAYRQAIVLDPKDARAYNNLGIALYTKRDLHGAIAAYRSAIGLNPKFTQPHTNLGMALYAKRDVDGAMAAFHRAIALNPKDGKACGALGEALLLQGRFAEGCQTCRRALKLLPPTDPLRKVILQRLQGGEQLLQFEAKLDAILKGEAQPGGPGEQMALAFLCRRHQKRYAAAARFYAGAFAGDPRLAKDLRFKDRYNAACAAALAAAGQGEDAAKLPDKLKARLRQQALDWLQEDLAAWKKVAEKGTAQSRTAVQKTLQLWKQNPDLTSLRDKAALAKLPETEWQAWQKLWAEVEAVVKRAQGKE
jgi:tetratricopeptide (TPR) repeat protein